MASTDSFEVYLAREELHYQNLLETRIHIKLRHVEQLLQCGEVAGSSEKTGGAPEMKKPKLAAPVDA